MAAVTQRVANFLGGISQQPDDLKFPGQLKTCTNAYPDPTFGLIKRPGSNFIAELKDNSNNVLAPSTFNNGKWFTIFRDATEQYVGVIYGTTIRIWSLTDGTPQTITYGTGATSYLTGTKDDYDVLTINDFSFITNKTVTVTTQAAPTYNTKRRATIRLLTVAYGAKYEVKVDASTVSYTTFDAEATITTPSQTEKTVTADVILNSLTSSLNGLSGVTATRIGSTIEVEKSTAFDISAKGGTDGEGLVVFQDSVDNITRLPNQAKHGRIVKIANTQATQDDYYVEFVAANGVSGVGFWQETRAPDVSPGLTAATMPHELIRTGPGAWTFRRSTWEDRLTGDDETNEHPSFVGSQIQQLFFYNDRLGILTEENVSMSQIGDYYNFYHTSALTVTAADPVDISCSSIKPATLHGVIPVAQGLVLFSRFQQFILQGSNGLLTPQGTTIKTISNYELDPNNDPVDLGTTVAFLSKTPSYSRLFEMMTRGQDESPIVNDVSNIVPELIPSTVDQIVGSPQNSILSLGTTGSKDMYLFRYYSTGGESRELQTWFKWTLTGELLTHAIERDSVWMVVKRQNSCMIEKVSLIQSPTSSTFLAADGSKVDPRLDLWKAPTTKTYVTTPGDIHTRILLPYKHDTSLSLRVVTSNPGQVTPTYSNSGQVYEPTVILDSGNYYAKVPNVDISGEDLVVGYKYDMDIEIPKVYYRDGDKGQVTDWSATLILARLKFLFGLGGDVTFKLKTLGRSEWVDAQSNALATFYLANDIPLFKTAEYVVPVHQRAENVEFRIFSDSPFPVSLISMKWEGNYSPRYYRRA